LRSEHPFGGAVGERFFFINLDDLVDICTGCTEITGAGMESVYEKNSQQTKNGILASGLLHGRFFLKRSDPLVKSLVISIKEESKSVAGILT
jgi:hypothetical protein